MPYVKEELRTALEFLNPMPSNAGELNYAISHLCHRYIVETRKGVSYANCNEVMGVLDCAKLEFYRTVVAPYEDVKMAENGPVSALDAPFLEALAADVRNIDQPHMDPDALVAAISDAVKSVLGPAKQPATAAPVAENKSAISAPYAANEPAKQPATAQPSVSRVRRPAVVLGPPAGIGDAPLPNISVAAAEPKSKPKDHVPVMLDKHIASVWDEATRGNGEDDPDI
jgi:hypothetical protein